MRQLVRAALLLGALILALWSSTTHVSTQSSPQYGVSDFGTLGGSWIQAMAMSDTAFPQVYGFGANASGDSRAFGGNVYTGPRDLGTLGGRQSEALGPGIGSSQIASGEWHAFMTS